MSPEEYQQARDESRLMIVDIDPELLLMFFNWTTDPHQIYAIPSTERIPEGTRVIGVHSNFERRCLSAVLCHISFEKCDPGAKIPRYQPNEYVTYLRRTPS